MKATYLSLLTYTDLGARSLKQSPERASAWRRRVETAGVKVIAQLWTAGTYDGILILQGDSEEQVLKVLGELGSQGNVRTHSFRAFDAEEFAQIAGG